MNLQEARVHLAAAYRLVALFGWDDLVFTHISLRVPGEDRRFLINPYGLFFDEITASSLLIIDENGQKVVASDYDVNPAGFNLHAAIHSARHDACCVLHTHTIAGVAVSALTNGLEPISQHSLVPASSLSYHDYEGVVLESDERPRLVTDLGDNHNMILRNHGLLTLGSSVAEAFFRMYYLETACRIQLSAQATGKQISAIPTAVSDGISDQLRRTTKGLGAAIVWPGLLRKLDRIDPSFRQ